MTSPSMPLTALDLVACATFALLMGGLVVKQCRESLFRRFPPGPKGWPVIGNLLDMPQGFDWETYQQWGKEFDSPIIHVSVLGQHIIVINDVNVASDLFDKRGSIYSDRPRLVMLGELIGLARLNFGFMRYGTQWRASRKLFHHHFHPEAAKIYRPKELKGVHELLRNLLAGPDHFDKYLSHMPASLILSIAYGIDVRSEDDPYIELADQGNEAIFVAGVPGRFLVDTLPILKYVPSWLPGAGFQRQAHDWHEKNKAMYNIPFDEVKAAMATGGPLIDSVTGHALAKLDPNADNMYQEECIRACAGVMYSAGSDTIVSVMNIFFLFMVLHPEFQDRAQRELDTTIGSDRLPDFDDQSQLPYITSLVNETLRWYPIVPLGVPHRLTADDWYDGYYLPKGSTVVGNSWAMLRDERVYGADAAEFNPSRFLDSNGKLNPSVKDPVAAFGHGRRICPGRYMARDFLWIAVANVLATLRIEKAVDETGQTVEPKVEWIPGLVMNLRPFKCSVKPRSAKTAALIDATAVEG